MHAKEYCVFPNYLLSHNPNPYYDVDKVLWTEENWNAGNVVIFAQFHPPSSLLQSCWRNFIARNSPLAKVECLSEKFHIKQRTLIHRKSSENEFFPHCLANLDVGDLRNMMRGIHSNLSLGFKIIWVLSQFQFLKACHSIHLLFLWSKWIDSFWGIVIPIPAFWGMGPALDYIRLNLQCLESWMWL